MERSGRSFLPKSFKYVSIFFSVCYQSKRCFGSRAGFWHLYCEKKGVDGFTDNPFLGEPNMIAGNLFRPDPERFVHPSGIWVISDGKYTDLDLSDFLSEAGRVTAKEYRISELARYLLEPGPVEVRKRIVGCEVHEKSPRAGALRRAAAKILPRRLARRFTPEPPAPRILLSSSSADRPALSDIHLEAYLKSLANELLPFDPLMAKIRQVDAGRVSQVRGLCEDAGGNLSYIDIEGGPADQIDYVCRSLYGDAALTLASARVEDGVFEMGGFDFENFKPARSYRLLTFLRGKRAKSIVQDDLGRTLFFVDDPKLVRQLQLLDASVREDNRLAQSLALCTEGRARALKLIFNHELGVDYTREHLPRTFREVLSTVRVGQNEIDAALATVNRMQCSISFSCMVREDGERDRMQTSLSVMHDVRALEDVREAAPRLYREVVKRARMTDAGNYYLLDAIQGA